MAETIAAAHQRLHEGRVTAVGLLDESLQAVDAHGAATNAFIRVDPAGAHRAAAAVDAERAAGVFRGPLHGIPISIKDLIDEAGMVTTAASHVLDDRVAASDATVVSRLKEAGAVIIGRTNLHQFALGTTSEDSAYGPVRHPDDATRVAGGSSGGAAVAVAMGMGLASVGTDTGGSIRLPAALCGVVGLKGTYGDVPTGGVIPVSLSCDHVGPLASTVQDAAWMWQVMAGRPIETILPLHSSGLRLKHLVGYFDALLAPVVRDAFAQAADDLCEAGVTFSTGEVANADRIGPTYVDLVLPEAALWHAPYLDTRADDYHPTVRARILHGRTVRAADHAAALDAAARFRQQVDALLADCDALVLPTLPIVAPAIGAADVVVDPAHGPGAPRAHGHAAADPTLQPHRSPGDFVAHLIHDAACRLSTGRTPARDDASSVGRGRLRT